MREVLDSMLMYWKSDPRTCFKSFRKGGLFVFPQSRLPVKTNILLWSHWVRWRPLATTVSSDRKYMKDRVTQTHARQTATDPQTLSLSLSSLSLLSLSLSFTHSRSHSHHQVAGERKIVGGQYMLHLYINYVLHFSSGTVVQSSLLHWVKKRGLLNKRRRERGRGRGKERERGRGRGRGRERGRGKGRGKGKGIRCTGRDVGVQRPSYVLMYKLILLS